MPGYGVLGTEGCFGLAEVTSNSDGIERVLALINDKYADGQIVEHWNCARLSEFVR